MKKFAAILAAIMILAMLCGTIVPVSATEAEVEELDSSLYDAAAEGDLLYTLNFNGDERWQPETYACFYYDDSINNPPTITVDPDNPNKCVFSGLHDTMTHGGGPVVGLPLAGTAGDGSDDYYAYTVIFKTVRDQKDEDGNCIDAKFGLYVDDPAGQFANGIYGYSYKMGLMNGSERIFKGDSRYTNGDVNFINAGMSMQGINYREEGVDMTQASVQEYAMEINAYDETYKLFMKDSTGSWVCIQASEIGDVMSFNGTYLFPTLYAYDPTGEKPITVEYVNIYKGMTLSGDDLPVAPTDTPVDTTTAAQDTTTAAPADTTTAAPADTTTNAPVADNTTTAAPTVTTEAPKSSGCGGFAVLPMSIVAILGLGVTVVAKKIK